MVAAADTVNATHEEEGYWIFTCVVFPVTVTVLTTATLPVTAGELKTLTLPVIVGVLTTATEPVTAGSEVTPTLTATHEVTPTLVATIEVTPTETALATATLPVIEGIEAIVVLPVIVKESAPVATYKAPRAVICKTLTEPAAVVDCVVLNCPKAEVDPVI